MTAPRRSRLPRLAAIRLEDRVTPAGSPFTAVATQYVNSLPRGGTNLYDLQPTVLYDPTDTADANGNGVPDRLYKMWWLGGYNAADPDVGTTNAFVGDRIYLRTSEDGVSWSAPTVVIKGQDGDGGPFRADDHLVGSPSVLKVNGTYYLFMEAYNQVTPINSFYSYSRQDSFVTGGEPDTWYSNGFLNSSASTTYSQDWDASYFDTTKPRVERPLGFAPEYRRQGTHPVYVLETKYSNPGGPKYNRQLSTTQPVDMAQPTQGYINRSLKDAIVNGAFVAQPVFYLYDDDTPDRAPIYQFYDQVRQDTYATTDGGGTRPDGLALSQLPAYVGLLGYADKTLANAATQADLRNRIVMLTSTDGVHWTRFAGPAAGGAVISPQLDAIQSSEYDLAAALNHQFAHPARNLTNPNGPDAAGNWDSRRWRVNEFYGSGFPAALERDGNLELYFTDVTATEAYTARRVQFPLSQIENPQAWAAARAAGSPSLTQFAGYGGDIKWSPLLRRYFVAYYVDAAGSLPVSPAVVYSAFDPPPTAPPTFDTAATTTQTGAAPGSFGRLPTGTNRQSGWGGLLADGLGHVVDNFAGTGTTRIDVIHEAYTGGYNVFATDLDHARLTYTPARAQAGGAVFDDRNRNGVRDPGEAGVAGVTVYHDANGNGVRDPGEAAAVTAAAGQYTIADLPPAYCTLRVVPPTGTAASTAAGGAIVVANTAGETFADRDFGLRRGRPMTDFDGDGKSDLTTVVAGTGNWSIRSSLSGQGAGPVWGGATQIPVGGVDFDGDGRADLATYDTGTGVWSVRASGTGQGSGIQWGGADNVPVGDVDFDGDGKTDLAAYRPSDGVWSLRSTATGLGTAVQWGGADQLPVGGIDFDGDGKTDLVAYRPSDGVWSVRMSATGQGTAVTWGGPGRVPVGGVDLDGDGKGDLATYQTATGVWSIRLTATGQGVTLTCGGEGQTPVGGVDFDGDGRTDLAAYRASSGTWSLLAAATGLTQQVAWGGPGQVAVGAALTPPRVAAVAVNGGAAQRSRVTTLAVTFTQAVTFAGPVAAAFQLTRIGGGSVGTFTATAGQVGGVTVVTLSNFAGAETDAGSLADGRYRLRILPAAVSAGGFALDGDGDIAPGADFVYAGSDLFRFLGDADGDGAVDGNDLAALAQAFNSVTGDSNYHWWLDLDGDGAIDGNDLAILAQRFNTVL